MDILGLLALFGVIFAAIISLPLWRAWMKLRMIAVAIPAGSDPQAVRYKLTEAIRSYGFREAASGLFRAPAWQKWAVGLQDISLEQAGSGAVLVTGPARAVSRIGRIFAGVTAQPYNGRQPVWPLVKGCLRMFAILIVLFAASLLAVYLSGVQ
jgi:hypothetical protein